MRILIIEDNRNLVQGLRHNLELEGHEVTAAYTGEAGLARARADRLDLILLDLMRPAPTAIRSCAPSARRGSRRRSSS